MKQLLFFLICWTASFLLYAQDNIGLKFFGLSVHPKGEKENAHLMPRKLDRHGYFVLNMGGMVSYEKFLIEDILSIKTVTALYATVRISWVVLGMLACEGGYLSQENIAYMVALGQHWFFGRSSTGM